VEPVEIGPVEITDPATGAGRRLLVEAIAEADELATALPSVDYYSSGSPGSVHRLLAAGLREKARRDGPPAVIYAAENHNHAAEILEAHVLGEILAGEHAAVADRVRFLNTVIGKMSRLVVDPDDVREYALAPLTPGLRRAVLVESFNRILISRIRFDADFVRGITAFEEKDNLLPFEEAKLYGHNATHALGGYLGALAGIRQMADLPTVPGLVALMRAAFVEESGAALIRRHHGIDPLFTPAGYTAYADDLLERMMNPHLRDTVDRVTRDTDRKLGWSDRFIGTMRLALENDIEPRRYALGAAAALVTLAPQLLDGHGAVEAVLRSLWNDAPDDDQAITGRITSGLEALRAWVGAGFEPRLLEIG
jgi:mannitol-1-phosphate 5-dehydrogenase